MVSSAPQMGGNERLTVFVISYIALEKKLKERHKMMSFLHLLFLDMIQEHFSCIP